MRFVTYEDEGGSERAGVLAGDGIHALPAGVSLLGLLGDDGTALREAGESALARGGAGGAGGALDAARVRLLAPIPRPPTIRDFYAFEQHVATARRNRGLEMDPDWYELPVFYFTNPYAVVGPEARVRPAPGSERLDFELEVAAVVGRGGANLTPEEAARHLVGLTIMNDWSARYVQMREMRLSMGPVKGKDFATSLGPWLVTMDEVADAAKDRSYDLTMTAAVNGREYSRASLADIWWSFGEMLSYASRGTRIEAGDVIGSGTCGTGCILELSLTHGSDAYPWLQPGDVVELSVDRLGTLRNVVAEPLPLTAGGDRMSARLDGYLARLDALDPALRRAAATGAAEGALTDPDPGAEERWDAGQVWAHLAEFVPYWIGEARTVIDPANPEPVPFGRVKTDAGRIAAIEERRAARVGVLSAKVATDIDALRAFLEEADGLWERRGVHSKLGEMPLSEIVEEFLVGHLDEHLRQLEGLFAAG